MLMKVFHCFPPFFRPKSKLLLSLFAQLLFFKERWEQFALVTLYKEWPWVNRSGHCLQKSGHEWFTPISIYKRVMRVIRSVSQANHSFPHKKLPICSKKKKSEFPNLILLNHLDSSGPHSFCTVGAESVYRAKSLYRFSIAAVFTPYH